MSYKKTQRKKRGVLENMRCYLCNNKAQIKCDTCKEPICADCLKGKTCYKCEASKETINM